MERNKKLFDNKELYEEFLEVRNLVRKAGLMKRD